MIFLTEIEFFSTLSGLLVLPIAGLKQFNLAIVFLAC